MPTEDHLVLLGATLHVTRKGASLDEIRRIVAAAGGDDSLEAVTPAIERLLAANHLQQTDSTHYRASAGVIDWFSRTHRCYSGMEADAENVREYLGDFVAD